MPASYKIDLEHCIILSTASGTLTDEELRSHQRDVLADPDFESTLNQLWDLREVVRSETSSAALGDLARARSYSVGTKRALVAPRDVQFGMARMFQTLHDGAPEDLRVFRSLEEARDWLGLEPTD